MDRQTLIDYVAAATYFYGMIPMEKVGQLFEGHTGIGFSRRAVRQFAEAEADALEARFVRLHGDLFVFESIDESDDIGTYLERTHRKRYFVPEMEELLRYGDQFYVEMTPQAKALKAFL